MTPVLFAAMVGPGQAARRTVIATAVIAIAASTGALAVWAATAEREPVTRTILGETAPVNAPGQEMTLQRVVIDPGAELPEHFHEGTQLARIRSGVLTYHVVSGAVAVTRADNAVGHGAGGSTEIVTAPGTVKLRAGDTIVEDESLVHYGENRGTRTVVIELVALLHEGAPLSTGAGSVPNGGAGSVPGTTPMRLETVLTSVSRTLYQVGPGTTSTYGWNRLTGAATLDGQPVTIELLASVDYTAGNGPFSGFVTFTFADGSTLGVTMQGMTRAAPNTTDASFAATLGVIGGTGTYVDAAGHGTFTGERQAALGGQVDAVFDLDLDKLEG